MKYILYSYSLFSDMQTNYTKNQMNFRPQFEIPFLSFPDFEKAL